uniref:Uncharacterized protein AlNc14C63G4538 n=1 Tax=Albugo laibachii Nc14 TaxID=890382 RepID=F0WD15_9STRA|nr:conserved hypothetical protein [Albugo laibachii Nc14]|eukprot:CCA19087.1 conserved hypothetical protein [Albugo laibachii Nc14]
MLPILLCGKAFDIFDVQRRVQDYLRQCTCLIKYNREFASVFSNMTAFSSADSASRLQPPSAPIPPALEGYLKKLKRKTSILSGGFNTRWFFVDTKRLEFGYTKTKATDASRRSIYLNDITAVVQFDDFKFQVESKTRNFFLCGESKASTSCWVQSLEDYRRKVIEYIKESAVWEAGNPSPVIGSGSETHSVQDTITNQGMKNFSSITSKNADDQSKYGVQKSGLKQSRMQVEHTRNGNHEGLESCNEKKRRPMNAWG